MRLDFKFHTRNKEIGRGGFSGLAVALQRGLNLDQVKSVYLSNHTTIMIILANVVII